jgi:Fe-S-cluster containining protein
MKIYDRGDGVCKHLTKDNRCEIYDHRPLICDTDRLYNLFYINKLSREEYDKLNEEACKELMRLFNEKEERDGR